MHAWLSDVITRFLRAKLRLLICGHTHGMFEVCYCIPFISAGYTPHLRVTKEYRSLLGTD